MNSKLHKGIFITGTDTGVGKTFVAAGLISAFKRMGFSVCPMKPLETGCRVKKGRLVPEDALKLIEASNTKESLEIINPYRFRFPLAPAVAAELEGRRIDKKKILSSYNYLSGKYDITLIEGAGGIMVPVYPVRKKALSSLSNGVYKKYLFLDIVQELDIPLIIISRPTLGTINHTLLTIEAVRGRGIGVIGVIINYASKIKRGLAEKTNPDVIEKLGGVPVLGVVPYSEVNTPHLKKIFYKIAKRIYGLL